MLRLPQAEVCCQGWETCPKACLPRAEREIESLRHDIARYVKTNAELATARAKAEERAKESERAGSVMYDSWQIEYKRREQAERGLAQAYERAQEVCAGVRKACMAIHNGTTINDPDHERFKWRAAGADECTYKLAALKLSLPTETAATERRRGHSALRVQNGQIEKFDPHPAADLPTQAEREDDPYYKEAFIKLGYWPNEVLWKVWTQGIDAARGK